MAHKALNTSMDATSGQRLIRKRHGGPRSKTGCLTCRIRHIKCDETKPACNRCTMTGRKCDGYAKKTWEVVDVPSMASILMPSSDPRAASDQHAGRSFKIFESMTAGYLVGLFEYSIWQEVLRASHHNDAIWQAAVALGSAHEVYLHRKFGLQCPEEDRALQRYNRAIRSLTKSDAVAEQPPLDVVMAVSVIFMVFEMLRCEYGKAINHIRSGISIFGEYISRTKSTGGVPMETSTLISIQQLENVLRQLEIHLCELCMERFPGPSMPRRSLVGRKALPQENGDCLLDSAGFSTIYEAKLELDSYWHNLMFVLHEISEPDIFVTTLSPEDFRERCRMHQQALSSWRNRFDILLKKLGERPDPFTSTERKSIAQLQLYQIAGAQVVDSCLVADEMVWDNYRHGFEQMINVCDVIMETDNGEDYCGFQLDIGTVAACFHTLWKCRSAKVRQRALNLLQYQRQEGLWDAHLVAIAGRQIDEVERGPDLLHEASLRDAGPEEIPRWRRILGIDIVFSPESREAVLIFMKQKSEDDNSLVAIKKILNW